MPPVIDQTKCTGCGTCVEVCTEDVFFGSEKGKVPTVVYPEFCVHLNCCVYECPEGAIKMRIPLPQMILYKGCD
jgi:NAD-dependent dihydropyrimidine dehydrogenase PreA subunit